MAIVDVTAGDDLQGAINAAQPGDTLRLESRAAWSQDLLFVEKSGEQPVTITCADELLPAPGNRVTAEQSTAFPKLIGNHKTSPRAANYVLRGLRIESYPNYYTPCLLDLGATGINGDIVVTSVDDLPRNWTLEHCFLTGDPLYGGKRGIAANCSNFAIRDSVVEAIWSDYQDSQAIACWNGPGPLSIVNNKLEGSGENIMFGGACPSVADLVAQDIVIEGNWIYKPLAWQAMKYAMSSGRRRQPKGTNKVKVKNQLEFKSGCKARIKRNIFENNWVSAQSGFGILFTVRTCEAGNYPWACVTDVEFAYNVVISECGLNWMGCDEYREHCGDPQPIAGLVENFHVHDNVIKANWIFQIMSGTRNVTIERNTCNENHSGSMFVFDSNPNARTMTGLVVRDNLLRYGQGITGSSASPGTGALDMYWEDWVFEGNAVHGVPAGDLWWVNDPAWYPAGNLYCVDISEVPADEYGCDQAALEMELKHVRDGQTAATPQPPAVAATLEVREALPPGSYDVVAREV